MSLLATQADFEPADESEGASALYYQPADGSGYDPHAPIFAQRAQALVDLVPAKGTRVAIWGCGYGALVGELVALGYETFGFDASTWALERGNATFPAIASRLFLRDALNADDVAASRVDAGLKGNQDFDVLITEDLLTCMSDDEIAVTLPLLRAISRGTPVHMVTPLDQWSALDNTPAAHPAINWKSPEDWKMLVEPDTLYDAVARAVV